MSRPRTIPYQKGQEKMIDKIWFNPSTAVTIATVTFNNGYVDQTRTLLKNKNNVYFLLVEDPTYTDLFLCNSWDVKWFIKDFKDILTVKDQPSYQQLLLKYDN